MSVTPRWLVFAVAVLCSMGVARAQGPRIGEVSAGWNDVLPSGAWAPVRVLIEGGDEPVGGTIVVDIATGGRTVFRGVRPFASTPSSSTLYEVPVRVQLGVNEYGWSVSWRVSVTLKSQGGRTIGRWSSPPRGSDVPVIGIENTNGRNAFTLFVNGPASPTYAIPDSYQVSSQSIQNDRDAVYQRETSEVLVRWASLVHSEISSDRLPTESRLLESVRTLVLHTQTLPSISGSQRDAILEWVRDGGDLVLIGDDTYLDRDFRPAQSPVTARPVRANTLDTLERSRWPLGLGLVSLLPVQPADSAQDAADRMELWLAMFDAPPAPENRSGYYGYVSEVEPGDDLVNTTVARFDEVQPPPVWWLFAFVGLLAVCMGPVDRFILKRRKLLHRSWASALGWIGLASVLGIFAPMLVTSGMPQAGVVEITDIAPDGTGRTDRVITIFSSGRHTARFEPADQIAGVWQHRLEGKFAGHGFSTPATRVGDGAVVAPSVMRPRSLASVQESFASGAPVDVRLRLNDDGEPTLVISADRPFHMQTAAIWTNQGVHLGSISASHRNGPPSVEFEVPCRFGAIEPGTHFARDAFGAAAYENREPAIQAWIDSGRYAYAHVSVDFAEGPAIPGAPSGAVVGSRLHHARIPIELDDDSRAVIDALQRTTSP